VRGLPVTICCACGIEKGDRDPNEGWWTLSPRGRRLDSRDFCPSCAPHLLVRSDEIQASPVPAGLRIFTVKDVYMMLASLRTAGMGFDPRETLGWGAALRVAPLVGFVGLQPPLQRREFGFVPEEAP
jgi:hypothetical protein